MEFTHGRDFTKGGCNWSSSKTSSSLVGNVLLNVTLKEAVGDPTMVAVNKSYMISFPV